MMENIYQIHGMDISIWTENSGFCILNVNGKDRLKCTIIRVYPNHILCDQGKEYKVWCLIGNGEVIV